MGKFWKVNIYTVLQEQSDEHDTIVKKIMKKWKQGSPERQFWYFRKRFGPYNGRIMILAGYDSIGDWETWLQDTWLQDDEYRALAKAFYSTINQDLWDNVWWEEIPVE